MTSNTNAVTDQEIAEVISDVAGALPPDVAAALRLIALSMRDKINQAAEIHHAMQIGAMNQDGDK